MNIKEEQICRLCLKLAKDKFQIDDIVKHMFEILLLNLDLDLTRDLIVCGDCMKVTRKCLNFKSTCCDTEKVILSCSADRKEKHNIEVFYEETEYIRTGFDVDFNVCRFCMTRSERNNFIPLDTLMNETKFKMLSAYMAEMDFNTIKNPIVCANCEENLDNYFKLAVNSLNIEDKIKVYWKEKGTDNMGQVKLDDVLQFMLTDILEYPDKDCKAHKIKKDRAERIESYSGIIKQEELDIKVEETNMNENCYRKNESELKLGENCDTFPPKEYETETKPDMTCLTTTAQAAMEESSIEQDVLELEKDESSDIRLNKHKVYANRRKQRGNGVTQ